MGTRVIVLNDRGQVLLVRHSYLKGWYLPGGGIDPGETAGEAAAREVLEEAGVRATGAPELLGLFLNKRGIGRDHVALYVLREWEPTDAFLLPNREILEADFFDLGQLPQDVTDATRARLDDFSKGRLPTSSYW